MCVCAHRGLFVLYILLVTTTSFSLEQEAVKQERVMARKARFCQPGIPVLLHQAATPGATIIRDKTDLDLIQTYFTAALQKSGCTLHAFGFLSSEIWLVATPSRANSIQKLMQSAARRYAAHFFSRYAKLYPERKSLWGQRYRCVPLEAEEYLLKAMCYVEQCVDQACKLDCNENKVACSSALLHQSPSGILSIKPHLQYQYLADDKTQRYHRYRELCVQPRVVAAHNSISRAIDKQLALGSAGFVHALEVVSGIRLSPGKPGRPRKLV